MCTPTRLPSWKGQLPEGAAGIGRERVATMVKRMGIEPPYRRPNASKPAPGRRIFPYLLRGVSVERPDQSPAPAKTLGSVQNSLVSHYGCDRLTRLSVRDFPWGWVS